MKRVWAVDVLECPSGFGRVAAIHSLEALRRTLETVNPARVCLQPLKGCAGEVGRTPPRRLYGLTPGQAGAPRALWAGVVAAEGLLVSSLAKPIQHCP